MSYETLESKIASLVSIFMTLFLVVFPIKSYNFLRSERKYLELEESRESFGSLYQHVDMMKL